MSHSTISQRKTTPREEGNKLDELAEEILELYKTGTLGEVMKKINDKHKLHARLVYYLPTLTQLGQLTIVSKSQYRKRLEKWRVKKNVRRSDLSAWKRAGQELRETKHVDHESAVMYDGRIYSMQQVQGVLRRHDAPRLADKFNLSQQSKRMSPIFTIHHPVANTSSLPGGMSPETPHTVIVLHTQRNAKFRMPLRDLYRTLHGKYDAPWPSGLILSIPVPRMIDRKHGMTNQV